MRTLRETVLRVLAAVACITAVGAQEPRVAAISQELQVVQSKEKDLGAVRESMRPADAARTEAYKNLGEALADDDAARIESATRAIDRVQEAIDDLLGQRAKLGRIYRAQIDALERARILALPGGGSGPGRDEQLREGIESRLNLIAAELGSGRVPDSMRPVFESIYASLAALGEGGADIAGRMRDMFGKAVSMLERVRLEVWNRYSRDMLKLGELEKERTVLDLHKKVLRTAADLVSIEEIMHGATDSSPLIEGGGIGPELGPRISAIVDELMDSSASAPPPEIGRVRDDIRRRYERIRREGK